MIGIEVAASKIDDNKQRATRMCPRLSNLDSDNRCSQQEKQHNELLQPRLHIAGKAGVTVFFPRPYTHCCCSRLCTAEGDLSR